MPNDTIVWSETVVATLEQLAALDEPTITEPELPWNQPELPFTPERQLVLELLNALGGKTIEFGNLRKRELTMEEIELFWHCVAGHALTRKNFSPSRQKNDVVRKMLLIIRQYAMRYETDEITSVVSQTHPVQKIVFLPFLRPLAREP
jgi:hypothetical protein